MTDASQWKKPKASCRLSGSFAACLDRNSFPDFDDAFSENNEEKFDATPKSTSRSSPRVFSGSVSEQSVSSSCADQSIDMSIGARAALTEHLRHVALFGLDGNLRDQEPTTDKDDLDKEWGRIMDGNVSQESWSTFDKSVSNGVQTQLAVVVVEEDGVESVELVADLNASDYFNSNHVLKLSTPEKNKGLHHPVTHRRTDVSPFFPSFEDDEQSACRTSQESGIVGMFQTAMSVSEPGKSQDEASCPLSRNDLSEMSSSPEHCELRCHSNSLNAQHTESSEFLNFIPAMERTPSGISRDSSSFTAFERSPPRSLLPATGKRRTSPIGFYNSSTSRDQENGASNSISLALSPIEARAGAEAGRILRENTLVSNDPFALESASPIKRCPTPPFSEQSDYCYPRNISGSPFSRSSSFIVACTPKQKPEKRHARYILKRRNDEETPSEDFNLSLSPNVLKNEELHRCSYSSCSEKTRAEEMLRCNNEVSKQATTQDLDLDDIPRGTSSSSRSLLDAFDAAVSSIHST